MQPSMQRVFAWCGVTAVVSSVTAAFEGADPSRRAEVIQVSWGDQVHAVRQGRADIVYARESFDHSGLGMLPLLEEPRGVALHALDPLAAKASQRLADPANRRLLQDATAVPEWYEIATPAQRRTCVSAAAQTVEEKLEMVAMAKAFVILPRSTTAFYRRPDVSVIPIVDIAPSRVVLAWGAAARVGRATIFALALVCAAQTI